MLKDPPAGGSVFHPGALLKLADQLDSTSIARDYALTFLNMLDRRADRILTATAANDSATAIDAVLSLKVNAHMVGAHAIEQVCHGIEQRLLKADMPTAARTALDLPGNIDTLKTALRDFLSHTLKEAGSP
ncbi:Hpt domain-containing protein [Arthrobacter sp. KN11-1C]|uniref:Hpt domain-containing protein n=1 Tax=Arthrobacter sp. KN11-1C TaxID=3445774 RepID=UPI003FA0E23D